ncbi:MAG: hypothetical protein RIS70_808, partial [Planctomycetota bacterium]
TMENFNVVARWQERPLATPDEIRAIEQQKERIAAQQKDVNDLITRSNEQLVVEARRHVRAYVLAGVRQLWLDQISRSIGAAKEKNADSTLPANTQIIEAETYARGNAIKLTTGYGEGIGVILSNGNGSWSAEFDVTVPTAGRYQLETRYAAAASRPVEISLNGKVVKADGLRNVTGSWNPDTQKWHVEGVFDLQAGANVIRLYRVEPFPHIDKLLVAPAALPEELAKALDAPPADASPSAVELKPAFVSQWRTYLERAAQDANSPLSNWQATVRDLQRPDFQPTAETVRSLVSLTSETADKFQAAESAWRTLRESDAGKAATQLPDAVLESLRKILYESSETFPFAVPKNAEEYYSTDVKVTLQHGRETLKQLQDAMPKLPEAMAVSEGKIEDVPIHLRGNHTSLGKEKISRRFPQILSREQQSALPADRSGRLEFAHWLTQPQHPLTGRVIVNRVWQWHFGEGLVRSSDNFGLLGERPTHPELLDALALKLADGGWSLKRLHRSLLLSSTYRMSTTYNDAAFQADPDNRLWWRYPRRRLEAESIRDAILAVGGDLDLKMGGSLLPTPNRQYVTSTANVNPAIYESARRTLYLPVVRSALYEVLQAFDFAEPSVMSGKRDSTTVAPQALFMMNSSIVAQQSRRLAEELLRRTDLDDANRVRIAHIRAYGREPNDEESKRSLVFITRYIEMATKQANGASNADAIRSQAWQGLCRAIMAANEFVYID